MESEKLNESSDSEPSPDENTESKKGRTQSIQSCHQVWGQRIMREYKELIDEGPWGIFAKINDDDIYNWSVEICGPPDSPFALGLFKGLLKFSDKYPLEPPVFRFTSRIFHPNVAEGGEVCVDELFNAWTACHSAWSILITVQSILADPNPDEPLNPMAALYFLTNRNQYDEIVIECVTKYTEDDDEIIEQNQSGGVEDGLKKDTNKDLEIVSAKMPALFCHRV